MDEGGGILVLLQFQVGTEGFRRSTVHPTPVAPAGARAIIVTWYFNVFPSSTRSQYT